MTKTLSIEPRNLIGQSHKLQLYLGKLRSSAIFQHFNQAFKALSFFRKENSILMRPF